MARGSLGPFPKTKHLSQILAEAKLTSGPDDVSQRTEFHLTNLRDQLEADIADALALAGIRFLTALVFCTRFDDPAAQLKADLNIQVAEEPQAQDLVDALTSKVPRNSSVEAAIEVIREVMASPTVPSLFDHNPWDAWRKFDGPDFCDLARNYFSKYLRNLLLHEIPADELDLARFAHEASIITRMFSIRWFNACARAEVPDLGSVRWYFRHCLGKLDLELERETADWDEAARWSRKSKAVEQTQLRLTR